MKENIPLKERIIVSLSYLTAGWVGLIYMIILYLKKINSNRFLRYNIFQSVFLSLSIFLIFEIFKIICNILLFIPLIKTLVSMITIFFWSPIFGIYSPMQIIISLFFGYFALLSFMGKYPKIYWISDNIIVKISR